MPSEWVWVINPHGVIVEVKASEVEALLKKGYTLSDTTGPITETTTGEKTAPSMSTSAPEDDGVPALEELSRKELNELAVTAGVPNPGKLPNKKAVVDAINANKS